MLSSRWRSLALAVVLSLCMCVVATPAFAHAATGSTTASTCYTLRVHLHGSSPATLECVSTTPHTAATQSQQHSSSGGVTPYTTVSGCGSGDVIIYQNSNQSGYNVCFTGSGTYNMTFSTCVAYYPWGSCSSSFYWNDQASSYNTGNWVFFSYLDINSGSNWGSAPAHFLGNYPLGGVGNDQLSSICLSPDNYHCPL